MPINSRPPPEASRMAPNNTNKYTKSADTPSGMPQMPSVDRYRCSIKREAL